MTRHGSDKRIADADAGFTLIELLVVMAITSILLGLIFGPLIQSFNLTNRARVQALTQDTARRAMEIGMRDIANGVFVFDNAQEPIYLWVYAQDNTVVALPVPYAFVDLVPPARVQDQSATLAPQDTDPTTGLALNRGSLALPVAPGRVIVRYFLGLRNNTSAGNQAVKPYFNYYNNPSAGSLADHNPVIFYRAVVSPYLPNGAVDERFFAKDTVTGAPVIYNPNFFYDTTPPPAGLPPIPGFTGAAGYGQRWENWKAIARAMVPTDRADEVEHLLDDAGQPSYFNFKNSSVMFPRLNPLVRFQPTYVGNDAGTPSSISDRSAGAINVAPSTYVEQYGHWTIPYRLYIYANNLDTNPLSLFFWDNEGGLTDPVMAQTWDIMTSTKQTDNPAFLEPNQTPRNYGIPAEQPLLLDPTTGIQIDPYAETKLFAKPPLVMFTTDARRGLVNCAFPDSVMLHASKANAYVPTPSQWANDGDVPNGSLTMPNVAEINNRYTTTVANHANDSTNVIRYIRLTSPPSNGGNSPLGLLPNASIVPGSLVVKGPDMRPGLNRGREVVYKQISTVPPPGPNEFKLGFGGNPVNYVDPDPIYQDMKNAALNGFTVIFDSNPDNPGDVHSLPTKLSDGVTNAAPVTATYQFQTNLGGYTVKADYLTRQLMTLSLGVRLYEFNSRQPQKVTLTQKIKVRNLQR